MATLEEVGTLAVAARVLERERREIELAQLGRGGIGPGIDPGQRQQYDAAEIAWRAAADTVIDA